MLGVLEGAAREDRRRDRQPVVGHRDAARLLELGDVGQLLALLAARHRADRIDPRQPGLGGLLENQLRHAGVVVDRPGVGHARHGGEAARHSSGGAGGHRFLVLLSWLAQVHVHVDQAGTHHETRRQLHHLGAVGAQVLADVGNAIAVDQYVEHADTPIRRIDDVPALKKTLHALHPPANK